MKYLLWLVVLTLFSVFVSSETVEPEVGFDGFQGMSQGRITIIDGIVNNTHTGMPVEGALVTVYCNHSGSVGVLTEDQETGTDGTFWSFTFSIYPFTRCMEGDDAWAEVSWGGQIFESEHETVVRKPAGDTFEYDYANINVG